MSEGPDRPPARLGRPADRAGEAVLASALSLLALAWAIDLPLTLGLVLYTEQFLAAVLALSLALVFHAVRISGERGGTVPWYDRLAGATGFVACGYLAYAYPTLIEEVAYEPWRGFPLAAIVLVLLVEGLRRTAGWALTSIVIFFILYGLFGHLVPGRLAARDLPIERLTTQLALDPNSLLGTPLLVASSIVVAFVFFGQLLNRAGGAVFFTELSLVLMGRFRGGAAKIAIIASSLFGSISGSAVSNVVTTGIVTIPLMRRAGFKATTAAAIEAVASTGGQLMPPIMGASAFLMAEFLQVAYTEVLLAALVPAILYYLALFIQVDLQAARAGITRVREAEIPNARAALAGGWFLLLPFGVLIAALFWFNLRPEMAGVCSAVTVLVFGFAIGHKGRRMALGAVADGLRATGLAALEIILITAAAGLVIGVLNLTGLSFGLTLILVSFGKQSLVLLLVLAAAISVLLGMGMPTIGVYVLLATLVAPSLVELGVEPLAAHLFVLYFGMMSMITPPVAIAAFAAASLGGAPSFGTGWAAMRLGWPAYIVPFLFVAAPALLLKGTLPALALALVTAIAGVGLISAGVVGFLARPLAPFMRLAFVAAGLALLTPAGAFDGAYILDVAGAVAGSLLVARELFLVGRVSPKS